MPVYDALNRALVANKSASIKMSFAEIEALIDRPLPKSAYKYDAWWANEDPGKTSHSHSKAWRRAGYHAEPSRMHRTVTFRRKA